MFEIHDPVVTWIHRAFNCWRYDAWASKSIVMITSYQSSPLLRCLITECAITVLLFQSCLYRLA